eukprot:TRINITY_DN2153_c0_g1_i2.p1 TRINITY_DN2153_c0_g1~~TRINITY_DN2153_c0_g1_i2.p1  ORF type:complete len:604 (+),score=92.33 TRINITY_DN2153_c0_g1_i2:33-1814(+)
MAAFPHDHFRIFTLQKRIVLQPLDKTDYDGAALEIDRTTGSFTPTIDPRIPPGSTGDEAFGFIGTIKLLSGKYLLFITNRKLVGTLRGHKVWRITKTSIVPVAERPNEHLDEKQQHDERNYRELLEGILDLDFFYSPTYDLTQTIQRIHALDADPNMKGKPLWSRADPRFFWNRFLSKELIAKDLHSWIIPIFMGFVQIENDCRINGVPFQYALVSRRNWKRAGTRFFVRGVDVEGNVANNVESEQIVISKDGSKVTAFVETRGSIPVYWTQIPTMKYAPKISLARTGKETELAFRRHFEEQVRIYGKHTLVNLVNQDGQEGVIASAYEEHHGLLRSVDLRYIAFDFHHHCRNMKYENLGKLLSDVQIDFDSYGFFSSENGNVTQQQKGTFRTNCVDNLDRTNVVQTMFAREAFNRQLRHIGVLSKSESGGFEKYKEVDSLFKNIWANNADAISVQYSGTGALKNDFTRTGKRDFRGVLNDGINSVTRYYLNNFKDGTRQDGFELFLGNHIVDASSPSPFIYQPKDSHQRLMVIGIVFAMMFVTTFFAPAGAQTGHKTVVLLFWLVAIFVGWQLVLRFGKDWVNKPRLLKSMA